MEPALGVWIALLSGAAALAGWERRRAPVSSIPIDRAVPPAAVAFGVGVLAFAVSSTVGDLVEARHGWDFHAYHHAARALADGLDPYDHHVVARISGDDQVLGAKYPPLALRLFQPLLALDVQAARDVYLAVQVAAAVGLLALWVLGFPAGWRGALCFVVAALTFDYAMRIDLVAGNVAVFEQVALWGAVIALARGRPIAFGLLVGAGAVFKLAPAAYLALALVAWGPRREAWWAIAVGVAVPALVVGASAALDPAATERWIAVAASELGETGYVHTPSIYGAWRVHFGDPAWPTFGCSLIVAGASLFALARSEAHDPIDRLLFGVTVIVLLTPRFKDYSFMTLVPPTAGFVVHAWRRRRDRLAWRALAVAALVTAWVCTPGMAPRYDARPLVYMVAIWALWAVALARPPEVRPVPGGPASARG